MCSTYRIGDRYHNGIFCINKTTFLRPSHIQYIKIQCTGRLMAQWFCTAVALRAQVSKDGIDPSCSELASRVLELMEEFPSLDSNVKEHAGSASGQLHTIAITLWNLGVTLKAKDNASIELNAQYET